MQILLKIMGTVSILLLVCSLICGLWIKSHPADSDMNFHFKLSLATVLIALITIVLFILM